MGRVFDELKRRNVFRVAVAYVVASWLVLQVADIVLQGIEAPAWVMKVFMLVLGLGFPFALLFSWAYELTPEGLKKEKDVDRSQSITPDTGRKLNLITIGMLITVAALVGLDRVFVHEAHGPAASSSVSAAPGDRSIAVLAFEDLSPEGDQAYFADGLSEELLNVLAKVGDLKVAGRTSSFAFKGSNTDLREIGELLNVAHILEGSVRKSGNRIRVTAQLIKADDGFHLFSETYDSELEDIFAVQDEIAQKISSALLTEIVGSATPAAAETNPEAYELYLMARQRIHSREIQNMREASTMLDRALEIDPDYAPAHAQKALVLFLMSDGIGSYGDLPIAEAQPLALSHVNLALSLDSDLAEAHAVKGLVVGDQDYDAGIELLEHARELNPTDSNTANWLHRLYTFSGRLDDARALLEEVVIRDPTYGPAFMNLVADYARTSQFDTANVLISRVRKIVGDNGDVQMAMGILDIVNGEPASGIHHLEHAYTLNPRGTVLRLFYGIGLFGIADFDSVIEVGLEEHRVLAYSVQDYAEGADSVLARLDLDSVFVPRALGEIGLGLNLAGRSEDYVAYVEARFGSAGSLLEQHPINTFWTTGYLGPLAWAYRQQGNEEQAAMLIEEMRKNLENDDDMHGLWLHNVSEAQYAALTGDAEAALAALRRAIDNGLHSIVNFEDPIFGNIADRAEYRAMRAELVALIDQQRAAVGMGPYRPLHSSEERRPNYVN